MLLEHPPVYTAGKRTRPADRPTDGTPVVDVDRGGLITWHGPGQLVGYPLVALATPLDVVDYVRRLEEALIAVVTGMGLPGAGRVDGRTGVWLPADDRGPERKVAAIGVRVQGGVTMHGFALNCDPDLTWFDRIVPCGITDAGVTSLAVELAGTSAWTRCAHATAAASRRRWTARCRSAEHVVARATGPGRPGPAAPPRPAVTLRQLRRHLGGDQLELVEVGQVEQLQVEALSPVCSCHCPSWSTTWATVPARSNALSSSTFRPIACARRATSASSRPTHVIWATERTSVAGSRPVAAQARRRARTARRPSSTARTAR